VVLPVEGLAGKNKKIENASFDWDPDSIKEILNRATGYYLVSAN
jgi:hypothetical protein